MKRERKILSEGKDYRDMLSIFRSLVVRCGPEKGDSLVWAGCPGPCYSMATFFSFGLRDLGLDLYFATDADINRLWRIELVEELGMVAAKRERAPKAKVLILMSGLLTAPFENVLKLVDEGLRDDGIIIGETVSRGLFEKAKWDEQIPFRYLFEFSMERPIALEIKKSGSLKTR